MTTYATSLITFAGYTFPIGARVKTRETSADLDIVKMLGLDGEFTPPGKKQGHTVTVEVEIGGGGDIDPVRDALISSPSDLNAALNDLFSNIASGYQALVLGTTPAVVLNAQYRKYSIAYMEGSGRRHATVSLEFYAPDPRWLALSPGSLTASGTANNAGNAMTFPYVTFTGAGSGQPTLKVQPNGFGGKFIQVQPLITLASGDVLIIDCDPRNRANSVLYTPSGGSQSVRLDLLGTSGISNTIGDDFTFPYMTPGNNGVTLSGASTYAFAWSSAYLL